MCLPAFMPMEGRLNRKCWPTRAGLTSVWEAGRRWRASGHGALSPSSLRLPAKRSDRHRPCALRSRFSSARPMHGRRIRRLHGGIANRCWPVGRMPTSLGLLTRPSFYPSLLLAFDCTQVCGVSENSLDERHSVRYLLHCQRPTRVCAGVRARRRHAVLHRYRLRWN